MPDEAPNQAVLDAPSELSRVAGRAVKIIGGLSALVAGLSTLYATLFSPDANLLRLLAFAALLIGLITLAIGTTLLLRKKRVPLPAGGGAVVTPAFSAEERAAARKLVLPTGLGLLAVAAALFTADHLLQPTISEVSLLEGDREMLRIRGSGFGHNTSRVRVRFSEESQKEFVASAVLPDLVEVAVPPKFQKGNISVRRGPRSSPPSFFAYPGIVYDAAVVELVQPSETDRFAALQDQFMPYPAFPYYSETSDKPTQWPPRVAKDRTAFHDLIQQQLAGPAGVELERWERTSKPEMEVIGDEGELSLEQSYMRLRILLQSSGRDFAKIRAVVGPNCARALSVLETARRRLASQVPNRLLVLRVRNSQIQDIENFTVEFDVGGGVYDVTLNAEGEKSRSLEWSPGRINIDIARLRPGYTADVQVWYHFLGPKGRVFPDAADFEWAKTEGIVIGNLIISNGQLRRSPNLLADLNAYNRLPVDPVKESPTFGQVITLPGNSSPVPETTQTSGPAPTGAVEPAPSAGGAQAILIETKSLEDFQRRDEALEAQVGLRAAGDSFSTALSDAIAKAGGYWVFHDSTPVTVSYSNFSGKYDLSGGQLAILRSDRTVDVSKLAGWAEVARAGAAKVDYIPWDRARYEVILQFFTDPRDSKGDSKRLLTKPLGLDQVFDLNQAKAGKPNLIAPSFADLLRFSRARLVGHYHAPFTLRSAGEPPPFYLAVRGDQVNTNFYLPSSWMPLAERPGNRSQDDSSLYGKLSRLYDYGAGSRELSAAEFQSLFAPR